jgi:hypothetical protein
MCSLEFQVYNSRPHQFIRNSFVCAPIRVPSFELAIFLDTLVTGWLGYSSLENSLVVGGDFGTAAKYFRRNFTAPIHPPLDRELGTQINPELVKLSILLLVCRIM